MQHLHFSSTHKKCHLRFFTLFSARDKNILLNSTFFTQPKLIDDQQAKKYDLFRGLITRGEANKKKRENKHARLKYRCRLDTCCYLLNCMLCFFLFLLLLLLFHCLFTRQSNIDHFFGCRGVVTGFWNLNVWGFGLEVWKFFDRYGYGRNVKDEEKYKFKRIKFSKDSGSSASAFLIVFSLI